MRLSTKTPAGQFNLQLDGKTCLGCNEFLSLSNYYDNPSNSKDGKAARCIPCYNQQQTTRSPTTTYHYKSIARAKTKMAIEVQPRPLAERYNKGKTDYSLLPLHLLEGAVNVMAKGAEKYSAWNWAKGMPWSTPYACAMRHLAAWYKGETNDAETGENHIDHAICNLLMLKHFAETYQDGDDRPKDYF
jgi:hypothetical protein